jgi:hypothetical protein
MFRRTADADGRSTILLPQHEAGGAGVSSSTENYVPVDSY